MIDRPADYEPPDRQIGRFVRELRGCVGDRRCLPPGIGRDKSDAHGSRRGKGQPGAPVEFGTVASAGRESREIDRVRNDLHAQAGQYGASIGRDGVRDRDGDARSRSRPSQKPPGCGAKTVEVVQVPDNRHTGRNREAGKQMSLDAVRVNDVRPEARDRGLQSAVERGERGKSSERADRKRDAAAAKPAIAEFAEAGRKRNHFGLRAEFANGVEKRAVGERDDANGGRRKLALHTGDGREQYALGRRRCCR